MNLRIVDRYVLLDSIADGGTATVSRAFQSSTQGIGRLIVLKIFKADYLSSAQLNVQDFKKQIQPILGLNHPNIVQLFDIGEESAGIPYLATEYIHGKNLRQIVMAMAKAKVVLKPEFIAYLGFEIAKALHYAHTFQGALGDSQEQILHRNVSPQNILVSYDGDAKLIEFGLLSKKGADKTNPSSLIRGRTSYMPPEEVDGRVYDQRSDLFSLGTVLWEAAAGQSLFTGPNRNATLDRIKNSEKFTRSITSLNPAFPKDLDAVIMKLLEKDPAKRFQSAFDLMNAFERVLTLTFESFGKSTFSSFMQKAFKEEITTEAGKLKGLTAEAEKMSKHIVPTSKTAYLKKFQSNGDSDESEEVRIMMEKQVEGASGARLIELDTFANKEVALNGEDLKKQKGAQRGGFVRRSHQEILNSEGKPSGIGGVGSFNKDMFEPVAQKINRTNSKLLKRPGKAPKEHANYGWVIQIAVGAIMLFVVLPHFGIKLWSVSSLVENFSALSNRYHAMVSGPSDGPAPASQK